MVLALIIPYLGPFVYMLFRPPEYLEDVRERNLEIEAMEKRIAAVDLRCPVCHAEVDSGYLVCPVCTTKLKQACVSCGSPLEPIWQVCPYCETPIEPAAPGTIRGDLASSMPDNLVHGSDTTESAEREIALWFGD